MYIIWMGWSRGNDAGNITHQRIILIHESTHGTLNYVIKAALSSISSIHSLPPINHIKLEVPKHVLINEYSWQDFISVHASPVLSTSLVWAAMWPSWPYKHVNPGIILDMGSANEKRHYNVMSFLIGWAHIQNDPCNQYWFWIYTLLDIQGRVWTLKHSLPVYHIEAWTKWLPFYRQHFKNLNFN